MTQPNTPLAPVKPSLSDSEIELLSKNLHLLPKDDQAEILEALEVLNKRKLVEQRKTSLLAFIKHIDPEYKIGAHHRRLALILEDMAFGRKSRAIVNIAPRHGKSQLVSIYYPSWYIGNFPHKNIMMVSHTSDLAVEFGRKVRNLVDSQAYREVFPDVALAADSKSAGRWSTNAGGSYFAVGIGGAIAGRGADLLCLAGDTIVETKDDGPTPIKSVKLGQKILTFHGWETVTNKWLTIHNDCVKVNTIEASLEHPMLTTHGWVKAGELSIGDKILTLTLWRRICLLLKNIFAKCLPGKPGRG